MILEEILEVTTLKQLQLHLKPIVLINTLHFYDHLIRQFEQIYQDSFAKRDAQYLYAVVANAEQALDYIESYQPPELGKKWF
jgi:predicted Rossmann-fold nucleotide-binding protein